MRVTFFDRRDDSQRIITDPSDLINLLDGLRNPSPFFCELVADNGYNLLIGIGDAIGCAQFSPGDGSLPYLMARGNDTNNDKYVDFLIADTPTPVAERYCLPLPTIKEIAAHFVDTGEKLSSVSWEEI